jgi:adenylate kinase
MLNIVIFGAPGTGKGTQSQNIIDKYNLVHLSTGDILREEIKMGSQVGLSAKKYIDDGLLVPDSVIFDLLFLRTSKHTDAKGFIFDGFPRNNVQAEILDEKLAEKKSPISLVLYLDVTEEELTKRILYRSLHSGRADDTEEVIKKRVEVYNQQTRPLLDYYRKQGKLVTIHGMGTIDEVFDKISNEIDNYLAQRN